jgi:hypothetical protein
MKKRDYDKRWDNLKPAPRLGDDPLALAPLQVRVPVEVDRAVRSLPNRSAWMRRVLVEAAERELMSEAGDAKQ